MATFVKLNGSLNLDFIRNSPISDRFGLVANGFNHLLMQSSRLKYSLTMDSSWLYYLIDIQEKPLAWLEDSVQLLRSLVNFTYGHRLPDARVARFGITPQEHLNTLYNMVHEGMELVQGFKEHQKSFTEFITATIGGQWNLANFITVLKEDHGLRLSSSYRRRIDDNMTLYNHIKDFQRRLDRVEVEFHRTPHLPARIPQNLIRLDKFYGPPGVVLFRYPGLPPGRRFTMNTLLEHKFDLTLDVLELGATPWYLNLYYSL